MGSRTSQVSFHDGGKEPLIVSSSKKVILLRLGTPPPLLLSHLEKMWTNRQRRQWGTLARPEHFLRSLSSSCNLSVKTHTTMGCNRTYFCTLLVLPPSVVGSGPHKPVSSGLLNDRFGSSQWRAQSFGDLEGGCIMVLQI